MYGSWYCLIEVTSGELVIFRENVVNWSGSSMAEQGCLPYCKLTGKRDTGEESTSKRRAGGWR
jgi:hypothetical protein